MDVHGVGALTVNTILELTSVLHLSYVDTVSAHTGAAAVRV